MLCMYVKVLVKDVVEWSRALDVTVNSPPPKPEVILTNFFAEPTVPLVPITSRDYRMSDER